MANQGYNPLTAIKIAFKGTAAKMIEQEKVGEWLPLTFIIKGNVDGHRKSSPRFERGD